MERLLLCQAWHPFIKADSVLLQLELEAGMEQTNRSRYSNSVLATARQAASH
jgi:hypothetical protein